MEITCYYKTQWLAYPPIGPYAESVQSIYAQVAQMASSLEIFWPKLCTQFSFPSFMLHVQHISSLI
jgi:hypothetical protein